MDSRKVPAREVFRNLGGNSGGKSEIPELGETQDYSDGQPDAVLFVTEVMQIDGVGYGRDQGPGDSAEGASERVAPELGGSARDQ